MRLIHMAALFFVASLPIVGIASTAEARTHHYRHHYAHHTRHVTDANGNQMHRIRHARRGGACDGFQRCRCGTTAARLHSLPYAYKGFNLKMASEWGRAFPHTSFGPGVVGVKPHHVLTVVSGSSCSDATVHDDAGTYHRNVCRMTFVAVKS